MILVKPLIVSTQHTMIHSIIDEVCTFDLYYLEDADPTQAAS